VKKFEFKSIFTSIKLIFLITILMKIICRTGTMMMTLTYLAKTCKYGNNWQAHGKSLQKYRFAGVGERAPGERPDEGERHREHRGVGGRPAALGHEALDANFKIISPARLRFVSRERAPSHSFVECVDKSLYKIRQSALLFCCSTFQLK
jgi:hypothetical protein